MTKCQRSRWQHSHGVVVVIDYAEHNVVIVVVDYTTRGHGDSVSV